MKPRYSPKVDANQAEIVRALRGIGASPQSTAGVGDGCPDLFVGYRGLIIPMEVKTGKSKLKKSQEEWRKNWKGPPVVVVRNYLEAVEAVNMVKHHSGLVVAASENPPEPLLFQKLLGGC